MYIITATLLAILKNTSSIWVFLFSESSDYIFNYFMQLKAKTSFSNSRFLTDLLNLWFCLSIFPVSFWYNSFVQGDRRIFAVNNFAQACISSDENNLYLFSVTCYWNLNLLPLLRSSRLLNCLTFTLLGWILLSTHLFNLDWCRQNYGLY